MGTVTTHTAPSPALVVCWRPRRARTASWTRSSSRWLSRSACRMPPSSYVTATDQLCRRARLPAVGQRAPSAPARLSRRAGRSSHPGSAFTGREVQRCRRAPPRRFGAPGGPAAEAVRLTSDLRRSRERLVTAREEERRRLQRDLHDGIGPTLSGALMKMEVARSRLTERPGEADQMLSELAADTRRAIDEVRRLTYDLRPPVLDQLGLAAALREQAASFVGNPGHPLEVADRGARRTSPAQRGRGGGGLSDWARGSDERGAPQRCRPRDPSPLGDGR